ncbi:MAG: mannose-6-phosphate isomerase [Verrucomicrobia bacterium]|nr:mannose-6-phosphate isomerase [Verrucomicrobiota bacterium]
MLYPYRFAPILAPRVWGGQTLARYGKPVPTGERIGESWEISDRPDAQSIVINGPLKGQTLHQLIQRLGAQLLGTNCRHARFPLLIKLLDARERLSLQVHPPPTVAAQLGGEPKTEMWYILEAAPGAQLIAGLKHGVTPQQFETAPRLADLVHRFPVRSGDVFFVPSGRLHAIDAGLVIVEIQQNSDTTYRVHDWGRTGRALHVKESLASIDFSDVEPSLTRFPVACDFFRTDLLDIGVPRPDCCDGASFHIVGCVGGAIEISGERLRPGEFALLPAAMGDYTIVPGGGRACFLKIVVPTIC